MSARRSWLALLAVVPFSSMACGAHYQARQWLPGDPATPATHAEGAAVRDLHQTVGEVLVPEGGFATATVTRAGLKTREISSRIDRTILLSVRIAADPEVEVMDMVWSPASAPRCSGGHPALAILTDATGELNSSFAERAQVRWERPVVLRGQQVLSGRFDEDRPLLQEASVVDVRLVRHQGSLVADECVRVPITGPGVTFWNLKRWSVGGRLSWRRALRFTDSSVLLAAASIGRWWGPVRIGVEGIVGGTDDSPNGAGTPDPSGPGGTGLCFLVSGPHCEDVTAGGFALEASGVGWRWARWAIGWSFSWETLFARIKPVERHAIATGPRVALQFLTAAPDLAGVSPHSATAAWGFEVYAAAATELTGTAAGPPVTYGVSLVGF